SAKGLEKLFRVQPLVIVPLFEKFARFEDEYIADRLVVASYGALLLNPSADDLRATELIRGKRVRTTVADKTAVCRSMSPTGRFERRGRTCFRYRNSPTWQPGSGS